MTDSVGPDPEAEGWGQDAPPVVYPEYGPLPEARLSVNFAPGKPPLVTVRAHTAAELVATLNELESTAVYAAIGSAHASLNAQASLGAGLGPVSAVPAAPAPAAPTPPPFGANVSVPQAPGYQGPPVPPPLPAAPVAPAQPQTSPEFQQAGWYKMSVPFKQKATFDGLVAQYQLRKGRPSEQGQVSWNKADKHWYVAPEVAGAFAQFNPVPA